eukprot:TRINITY_DN22927_c0_g1_i1.p1 TRINITY_DN22927_c0_g1~~TRINITY_DN22927_c0_g1_i1.p1  ORF type:complete len:280 (+),score=73.81 TRINITY_DN22927_c0_g1_i1:109-948(+)
MCIRDSAVTAVKSERARLDADLLRDIHDVLDGGVFYLPTFFAAGYDFSILQSITDEFTQYQESEGMVDWSQHLKFENPEFSYAFRGVLDRMAEHFNVDISVTRLNFYRDGTDWKPFHHDRNAYYAEEDKRENFTMGASFGASRMLEFLHEGSGEAFSFPQNNGDVFAFNTKVNKAFKHGVPKAKASCGPRFSIIAWGRLRESGEAVWSNQHDGGQAAAPTEQSSEAAKPVSMQMEQVSKAVAELVSEKGAKADKEPKKPGRVRRGGRVQGGGALGRLKK